MRTALPRCASHSHQSCKSMRHYAGYWNAGGQQNVESMLTYLTEQYLRKLGAAPAAMVETPATGEYLGTRLQCFALQYCSTNYSKIAMLWRTSLSPVRQGAAQRDHDPNAALAQHRPRKERCTRRLCTSGVRRYFARARSVPALVLPQRPRPRPRGTHRRSATLPQTRAWSDPHELRTQFRALSQPLNGIRRLGTKS